MTRAVAAVPAGRQMAPPVERTGAAAKGVAGPAMVEAMVAAMAAAMVAAAARVWVVVEAAVARAVEVAALQEVTKVVEVAVAIEMQASGQLGQSGCLDPLRLPLP